MLTRTSLFLAVSLIALSAIHSSAAAAPDSTSAVFERFSAAIVQVRILERVSGTKAVIGSGFYISPDGAIVTNFHVISQLILYPNKYRVEVVDSKGAVTSAEPVTFDIVHDLAMLKADRSSGKPHLTPSKAELLKGERLYAFGNPHDLGLTIVEGTYNGLLENTLYEKIHFTGSINPGMSGGPAITADGQVVGVNVSTAGNEMSFLVPAKFVAGLSQTGEQSMSFMELARRQLLENQQSYLAKLLSASPGQLKLGRFVVPGQLTPAFRCWSWTETKDERLFEMNTQRCSTEDEIYISDDLSAGSISFTHVYLESDRLNPFQFYTLFEHGFQDPPSVSGAEKDDVTNFRCAKGHVKAKGVPFYTAYCTREYRKFRGLYDAVLKVASLNGDRSGIQTELILTGVSFENAVEFAKTFLGGFEWN